MSCAARTGFRASERAEVATSTATSAEGATVTDLLIYSSGMFQQAFKVSDHVVSGTCEESLGNPERLVCGLKRCIVDIEGNDNQRPSSHRAGDYFMQDEPELKSGKAISLTNKTYFFIFQNVEMLKY